MAAIGTHTQLNVINNNTESDTLGFKSFLNFVEGTVRTGSDSAAFPNANASRYYRSDTAGVYINDNYKIRSNLIVDAGAALGLSRARSRKNTDGWRLSIPACTPITPSTDTITNSGLEVAGNNATFGTPGASDSLLTQHQWGLAPRIGLAWTPQARS